MYLDVLLYSKETIKKIMIVWDQKLRSSVCLDKLFADTRQEEARQDNQKTSVNFHT